MSLIAIDLQIQSAALGEITARAVQKQLSATCFAPLPAAYIDHGDVVPGPVQASAANGAVQLVVPIDVFLVRREDVLAAPNGTPAGATTPVGRVPLLLELRVTGPVLSLKCVDADLGSLGDALGPGAGAAKAALLAAIGSPLVADLTSPLAGLGVRAPAASRIDIVDGTVAIRFDPAGAATAHLSPGQDWGFFLDAAALERLALSKVPADLRSRLPSLVFRPRWQPRGTTPHVDVDYSGKAPIPDPFTAEVSGTLGCDFSLTPGRSYSLRTTVQWTLDVDLGAVGGFLPHLESAVATMVAASVDPAKFGGTRLAHDSFAIDTSLPAIALGGGELRYESALASDAGMTVGGPIRLGLPPSRATVTLTTVAFGLPARTQFCSILARTGSGDPLETVTIADLTTTAQIWLADAGRFCDLEILGLGSSLDPYVVGPSAGTLGAGHDFRITVPAAVAVGIDRPVRVVVRTPRGVRLADLGTPPALELDADGRVTNAVDSYIDDCFSLPVDPDDQFGVDWGREGLAVDPRPELSWTDLLSGPGLEVQLVTLSGLEPGELVRFRSRDHAVDVIADVDGRALVPALFPLGDQQAPATLMRLNRRSMRGHLAVESAVFETRATLPAGDRNALSPLPDGGARLTREFAARVDVHEIGSLGALAPVEIRRASVPSPRGGHDEGLDRPASGRVGDLLSERDAAVPGATAVLPVPGFEEAPVAIASLADGTNVLLDLRAAGGRRVAGTFTGPIGSLDVGGDWALTTDGGRASVHQVRRSGAPQAPFGRGCSC